MHKTLAGAKSGYNYNSEISWITRLFKELITSTMITGLDPAMQNKWRSGLIVCVQEIAQAFELERPLLRAGKAVKLQDWMKLRVVTISGKLRASHLHLYMNTIQEFTNNAFSSPFHGSGSCKPQIAWRNEPIGKSFLPSLPAISYFWERGG